MFSFELKEDGSYKIYLPDGGHLDLPQGVEDTHALRRELAKLSQRIQIREFIRTDKHYIENWWNKKEDITDQQLKNLSDIYSQLFPHLEEWVLLDTYEHPMHETIAHLEREVLEHKLLLERIREQSHEKSD